MLLLAVQSFYEDGKVSVRVRDSQNGLGCTKV